MISTLFWGELSTDYLDRYSIIQKMKDEQKALNSNLQKRILPAVSSAILQSEFIKRSNTNENNVSNNWKFGGMNC